MRKPAPGVDALTRQATTLADAPIRIGVVGTGVMGTHHTRLAATLAGCELVGVYDASPASAERAAAQFGVPALPALEALCATADAIIVATPAHTHAKVAASCLQAGCHVLLEKPIATSVTEGESLVALAQRSDRVLMIGHVERFNPAVTAVLALIDPSDIFACDLQRLSTAPGRDESIDIIFDLMVHDLDLVLAFTQSTVTSVTAMGHCVHGGLIDHVTALLRFANGTTATITASAVSQERSRTARLFSRSAQFMVDFASRELEIYRQGHSSMTRDDGQRYAACTVEKLLVPNRDPLATEQDHFLQAIRQGTTPATDADAGLQALRLAHAIRQCVNEQVARR